MKTCYWLCFCAVLPFLGGCGTPSTKQTYAAGEQPSYSTIRLQTIPDDPHCFAEPASKCTTLSSILLTKPTDNLSMQFVRSMKVDAKGLRGTGAPYEVITCISPAAAVTSIGSVANGDLSAGRATLGLTGAQTESALLIQSTDPQSHFLATASFYNCLNYASDMYDRKTAASVANAILATATRLGADASKPKTDQDGADGFVISGTVTGLTGKGLTLGNFYSAASPQELLPVDPPSKGDASFKFKQKVTGGSIYAVTVSKSPSGQHCYATTHTAGVITGDVANVVVACQ
jgi:hypothetical protein